MCTRPDRGTFTRPEAPPPGRNSTQATMGNEPDTWALPPRVGFSMPRAVYHTKVACIGQETRNMKDGSLEVKTRLHQARLGVTAMSPHFTRSRAPHSHDAPMRDSHVYKFVDGMYKFADKNPILSKNCTILRTKTQSYRKNTNLPINNNNLPTNYINLPKTHANLPINIWLGRRHDT